MNSKITSRERVKKALNFEAVDRFPKDLGAMRSTGISAFSYQKLRKALNLPGNITKIQCISQMLAYIDNDVLDTLECDVHFLELNKHSMFTNCYEDENIWAPFDFNGRLDAMVLKEENKFKISENGDIYQTKWDVVMPAESHYFDSASGGQPLDLSAPLELLDLAKYKEEKQKELLLTDEDVKYLSEMVHKARENTDKAILVAGSVMQTQLGIGAHGGLGVFPVICALEPDYVMEYHAISTEIIKKNIEMLLPEIKNDVDIILTGGGDWGTQNTTIASPETFQNLFAPFMCELNDAVHKVSPELKTFIHSCGAVYDLLDSYIDECHIDVINPVQWTAGGKSFRDWKDKVRKRASLWGGAVNSQATLCLGDPEAVRKEREEVIDCFAEDGGYVFNSIHNILSDVPIDNVIALYDTN